MSKLRNILIGAGVAAVGAIGTKKAVDYMRNRDKEEVVEESEGDAEIVAADEVAYAVVEPSSVQDFLDKSFGNPGRYVPTRSPKVFEYQDEQYMVIWAKDNEKDKNQMMAFKYTDAGRQMVASVGYTGDATDYNLKLDGTDFAVEVNGEKLVSGTGATDGADEVDFVLA
ncbi:hypothetical protein I4641_05340 [Waterburya agarophytonicola K14]|uniref:Uncharacterized protein n=1 Tax=Waterburya agarophytonicola KI4 TaxID=2874699 RepID=A0A964BNA8_9CYAN|nr:hypothetical protein [Waterburya agarophytonicola]MCC0176400.1 hypothetical protein [Waterburya agarophytonicola KI4]